MRLMINGKEATKGMEVTTFDGEKYILTDWRVPGEKFGGMNGKVYCQTKEAFERKDIMSNEWYPSVIGGKFIEE